MHLKATAVILTLCAATLVALPALAAPPGQSTAPTPAGDTTAGEPQPPAAGEATAAKPKIEVAEPVHDFDQIAKGDTFKHDFVLTNKGDAPLEIFRVAPSCGCTVASFDKTIPPGGTGTVHTELDTSTLNGPVAKTVVVYSNDPDNPQAVLTLKADIRPYIAVEPGYARFVVVHGETATASIPEHLWATDGHDFDITSVESPFPYLDVSYHLAKNDERRTPLGQKEWKLDTILHYNEAPVGALSGFITLHTDHPKQKVVTIPVSGFVRPTVALTPQVVDFGKLDGKEPVRRATILQQFLTETVELSGIRADVPGISAEIKPILDGRKFEVILTADSEVPQGDFHGDVKIRTSSPKYPVIAVPFKGHRD